MLKKGQQFECTIEDLGFGGNGIVHIDGFVIFIKGAIPEQEVRAVVTKKKSDYAEAKVLEVLKKSPKEILAKCKHFGVCGGCIWQNLKYEDQIIYKGKQVYDCIKRIGKIESKDNDSMRILQSPQVFGYRNKLEFSFGYQSMRVERDEEGNKKYFDEDPTLGFHKPRKWQEVVDIEYCYLASENINSIFDIVKKWSFSQKEEVHNPKTHKGFWRQLLIRENSQGQLLINIIVNKDVAPEFFETLLPLINKKNVIHSVFFTIHKGLNDDWTQGEIIKLSGEDRIYEEVLDMKFTISPESFFQTNTKGAEILYKTVLDFVKKSYVGNKELKSFDKSKSINYLNILDLYCGTGTIGQVVGRHLKNLESSDTKKGLEVQVIGLELLESAVKDAYKNAEINGLKNVEYISGPAEKTFPQVLEKYKTFDVVIVDPPRAGMHPKALQTLLQVHAKNIIYVSCNPATLARDLKILATNNYQ
ncbi:23S rRNA (uracil(1939)-C(5))-methyltransferase RlmD, partial [Candidatus Peregrinibacteria bacterium]|nr:23S rRNA (uracil(1939)-C(5))-methyltransferase RlmD [Candidatus Peregrinibacteria bacterium]